MTDPHDGAPRGGASADYVHRAGLSVSTPLAELVEREALVGTDIERDRFWEGLASLIHELAPDNAALLERRAELQTAIDEWHRKRAGEPHDAAAYRAFLHDIGYIVPTGRPFSVTTTGVDPEITTVAGPQLVVPVTNARYALNAANARWGSFYDALYGTDALGDLPRVGPYNPARGARVVAHVRRFLDDVVPLARGAHGDVVRYAVDAGQLLVTLANGTTAELSEPAHFAGYSGDAAAPSIVLFEHHRLGIELVIDRAHPIGRDDPAGVADVLLEAAVTTIVDCEDSVAAVDGADKALVYRNWLGLMRGDLTEAVTKAGGTFRRALAPDRTYTAPNGSPLTRRGRALLLVRNVGHLMTTPAVLDREGNPAPEGLVDEQYVDIFCRASDAYVLLTVMVFPA